MIKPITDMRYMQKQVLKLNFDDFYKMNRYLFKRDKIYADSMRRKGLHGNMSREFLQAQPEIQDAFTKSGELNANGKKGLLTELETLKLPQTAKISDYLSATLGRLKEMAKNMPGIQIINGKTIQISI